MKKRVALVTGASQGIGRATAIRLSRDFEQLVLVARSSSELGATAEAVAAVGAQTLVLAVDLSLKDSAQHIVDVTVEHCGGIDAVVNIAGAVPQVDLLDMTDDQWNAGFELKLHGARRLTVSAWPHLSASKGAVVFTSGNSAVSPKSSFAAVGTVNAAIVALAKAFADLGVRHGVRVNSLLPGAVMTGRRRSYLEHWAAAHSLTFEAALSSFPEQAGISRYGKPEEIADLIAFLLSPGAAWMTGSAVRMDGGEVKSV